MYFIYDNISSQEFGLKIKKDGINNFSSPQRSYETIQVKGRNGDLIIDNGNYENFTLEIECYLDARESDLNAVSKEEAVYRQEMRRLCREAQSCGIPLEVNVLGKWSGRNYPNPSFWELAAEEGCQVVIGCDAHDPQHLHREDAEEQLQAMIRYYGLKLLDRVELRSIK